MLESPPERNRPQPLATAFRESDTELLPPLFEINASVLGLLAAHCSVGADAPRFALANMLREVLGSSRIADLRQAARCPLLLVELGSWHDWPDLPAQGKNVAHPWMPQESAVGLMRSAITFAWHASRTNPRIASVRLGLPHTAIARIGSLPLGDLERIAQIESSRLRLRWEDEPRFWRALLTSGRKLKSVRSSQPGLVALHMLVSDLLSSS